MPSTLRQNVALLKSETSRQLYVQEAIGRDQVYEFTDAWGERARWLKGEYAYLAPNAASAFLNRLSLKHDTINEEELRESIREYQTLVIPNAARLEANTLSRIQDRLQDPDFFLLVTGRTNLPDSLLGLERSRLERPQGFSGWGWAAGSPFGDTSIWEELYVTGARGAAVHRVKAAAGAHVPAGLYEITGDLRNASTATRSRIGDGIILTGNTLYAANQVFEFLGGVLQAHLYVDEIRNWNNPIHWGDTLVYFLARLLKERNPGLPSSRLRAFGSYRGVLSLRHDVDQSADLSMLEYEAANLVPASWDILDPVIADDSATEEESRLWVREVAKYEFLEAGLHNDSLVGGPPTYLVGTGLYDHIRITEERLGIRVYTCGRHGGAHAHPETLDAMDYAYEQVPYLLGTCTFCFYDMWEYGEHAYETDGGYTVASSGFWFPYHPVVTRVEKHKALRGWDRTHEYDCDYSLVDLIYSGRHGKAPSPAREASKRKPPWEFELGSGAGEEDPYWLENGVYTLQYHPLFSADGSVNQGRGTLDYLIYAITRAERLGFWLASEKMLYETMNDYESIRFRANSTGSVTLANPTGRRLEGFMVESDVLVEGVSGDGVNYIHIVDGRYFTAPPLDSGEQVTLRLGPPPPGCPLLLNANSKGLQVLNAVYDSAGSKATLELKLIRRHGLCLYNVLPERNYRVTVRARDWTRVQVCRSRPEKILTFELEGDQNRFGRFAVEVTPAPETE